MQEGEVQVMVELGGGLCWISYDSQDTNLKCYDALEGDIVCL